MFKQYTFLEVGNVSHLVIVQENTFHNSQEVRLIVVMCACSVLHLKSIFV